MSVTLPAEPTINRGMLSLSILLATIMTALDTTIANVALPHVAGSVSASPDQITWVLTSYLIAAAIMTPMSGWLSGRFGRKRVLLVSIAGFTIASAACGAATNLGEIVLFRLLQGAFGASLSPLSQAVMLDTYTLEERGPMMALWGMGVTVAPIVGPVLGGWLTDDFGWRWVFYINLPVGIISLLGVMTYVHERKLSRRAPFDVTGFSLLCIVLAAMQLFLDRGQSQDWFQSREVVIEATLAGVALILFIIHSASVERPFLPGRLLLDRNFVAALTIIFVYAIMVFSVMALQAPMAETTLGYPVVTAGMVMAPRGVGAFISMFLAGRLVGRVDNRIMILTGLMCFALAFARMSHFSLQMDAARIVTSGLLQGVGTGFVFVPISTVAFATLDPALRTDATGVFTLLRSLGSSVGISVMQTAFTRNLQTVHAQLVERLTPDNPLARPPYLMHPFSLGSPLGLASLDAEVTRQASMVAYTNVFHAMGLMMIAVAPIVLLLKPAKKR